MEKYILIFEVLLFVFSIPLVFKAVEILDFDKLFRKTHVNRKYVFYFILTVALSYLFSSAFTMLIENMLIIVGV